MNARQLAYLQAMGITAWQRRPAPGTSTLAAPAPETPARPAAPDANSAPPAERAPPAAVPAPPDRAQTNAPPSAVSSLDWAELRETALACRACALHESRQNVVFGVGARDAGLMLIGEAPGADEDRQGEPFVGRAGQLLNAMLKAIGLSREEVFIANMIKCRPPGNRDPNSGEVAACGAYLQRQVELIKPRLIVALGRVAAQHLLGSDAPLARLRGASHSYGPRQTPLLATYHPAYLLRKPAEKSKSWDDLKRIREALRA